MIKKHIFKGTNKKDQNFIEQTKKILDNPQYNHIISWNEDGNKILLKDKQQFESIILPQYFKHNKYTSYLRQLNLYGFRASRENSGLTIFQHNQFKKDSVGQMIERNRSNKDSFYFNMINEQIELRETLEFLQKEQIEIQKNLQQAINRQLQIKKFILNLLSRLVFIRRLARIRPPKFIKNIRILLKGMQKDSQQSFVELLRYIFHKNDDLLDTLITEEMAEQYSFPQPQKLTQNSQLANDIHQYLSHQSPSLSTDELYQFWINDQDSFSNYMHL